MRMISKSTHTILVTIAALLALFITSCANKTPVTDNISSTVNSTDTADAAESTAPDEIISSTPDGGTIYAFDSISKEDLVGLWHAQPGIPAGYAERWVFHDDMTFKFYGNEMDGTRRILSFSGFWDIKDSYLKLSVSEKEVVIGGEVVSDKIMGYIIEGGDHQIQILDTPEESILTLSSYELNLGNAHAPLSIMIGDTQYWSFTAAENDYIIMTEHTVIENDPHYIVTSHEFINKEYDWTGYTLWVLSSNGNIVQTVDYDWHYPQINYIDDKVLQISKGAGNYTGVWFYNTETNMFSPVYENPALIQDGLIVYMHFDVTSGDVELKVSSVFYPEIYTEAFILDSASSAAPYAVLERAELDGKTLFITYLTGENFDTMEAELKLSPKFSFELNEWSTPTMPDYAPIINAYRDFMCIEERNDEAINNLYDNLANNLSPLNKDDVLDLEWQLWCSCVEARYGIESYALKDLNGDWIPELIIFAADNIVCAVYSLDGDTPVLVGGYWSRHSCVIDEAGEFHVMSSSGAGNHDSASYKFISVHEALMLIKKVGVEEHSGLSEAQHYRIEGGIKTIIDDEEANAEWSDFPYSYSGNPEEDLGATLVPLLD